MSNRIYVIGKRGNLIIGFIGFARLENKDILSSEVSVMPKPIGHLLGERFRKGNKCILDFYKSSFISFQISFIWKNYCNIA